MVYVEIDFCLSIKQLQEYLSHCTDIGIIGMPFLLNQQLLQFEKFL